MELTVVAQALDRGDVGTLRLHGEDRAGLDRTAVEMHGACTALSGIAANMGTGEMELVADQLDQEGPGINVDLDGATVDGQSKGFGGLAQGCLLKTDFFNDPERILRQAHRRQALA